MKQRVTASLATLSSSSSAAAAAAVAN